MRLQTRMGSKAGRDRCPQSHPHRAGSILSPGFVLPLSYGKWQQPVKRIHQRDQIKQVDGGHPNGGQRNPQDRSSVCAFTCASPSLIMWHWNSQKRPRFARLIYPARPNIKRLCRVERSVWGPRHANTCTTLSACHPLWAQITQTSSQISRPPRLPAL